MARLLAAERQAARQHLLHHVLVADRRSAPARCRARAAQARGRCCSSRSRRSRRPAAALRAAAGGAHISSTASPLTTRPRWSTKIARSPSPSNATPMLAAVARRPSRASRSGCVDPQSQVDVAAVGPVADHDGVEARGSRTARAPPASSRRSRSRSRA